MFPGNGNVLYDGDHSPTRTKNYKQPQNSKKLEHKLILEQMFAKKTDNDIRSLGSQHSLSPTRNFGTIENRRSLGWDKK